MRAYLPAYDLVAPDTLDEALALLAASPGEWRPFAGGTDLMVQFDAGTLPEGRYLGLWKLTALRGIVEEESEVVLGALTTYTDLLRHAGLARDFPLLGHAAAETGGVATQNRGTIGGNIANASPAADTPPVLIAYDAEIDLVSARGTRRLAYDEFHRGYKETALQPDELVARIRLPKSASLATQYYRKVGTRRAQAISKVCLAATLQLDAADGRVRDVRIGVGSVAPTVVRARGAESALRGRVLDESAVNAAQAALAAEIAPIDDLRSTARYRRRVAQNLLAECLTAARAGAAGPDGGGGPV